MKNTTNDPNFISLSEWWNSCDFDDLFDERSNMDQFYPRMAIGADLLIRIGFYVDRIVEDVDGLQYWSTVVLNNYVSDLLQQVEDQDSFMPVAYLLEFNVTGKRADFYRGTKGVFQGFFRERGLDISKDGEMNIADYDAFHGHLVDKIIFGSPPEHLAEVINGGGLSDVFSRFPGVSTADDAGFKLKVLPGSKPGGLDEILIFVNLALAHLYQVYEIKKLGRVSPYNHHVHLMWSNEAIVIANQLSYRLFDSEVFLERSGKNLSEMKEFLLYRTRAFIKKIYWEKCRDMTNTDAAVYIDKVLSAERNKKGGDKGRLYPVKKSTLRKDWIPMIKRGWGF